MTENDPGSRPEPYVSETRVRATGVARRGVNVEHGGVHNKEIKLVGEGSDIAGIDCGGRGRDVLLVHGSGRNSAACEPED